MNGTFGILPNLMINIRAPGGTDGRVRPHEVLVDEHHVDGLTFGDIGAQCPLFLGGSNLAHIVDAGIHL